MKNIKINPLFFVSLGISYISGNLYSFLVTFLSIVVHELVHLFLMAKKHIILEKISIEPFGISIITKAPKKVAPIVFIGAPVFNLEISIVFFYLHKILKNDGFMFVSQVNLLLGLFNLLPIIPFDGGRFIVSLCQKKKISCEKSMEFFSIFMGIIITVLGIMFLKITNYNFSISLIGIFILFNAFLENENKKVSKSKIILEKSMDIKEKKATKFVSVPYNYPAHKLIGELFGDEYYIVNIIKNGKIFKTVTESQIIEKVVNSNKNLKIWEI